MLVCRYINWRCLYVVTTTKNVWISLQQLENPGCFLCLWLQFDIDMQKFCSHTFYRISVFIYMYIYIQICTYILCHVSTSQMLWRIQSFPFESARSFPDYSNPQKGTFGWLSSKFPGALKSGLIKSISLRVSHKEYLNASFLPWKNSWLRLNTRIDCTLLNKYLYKGFLWANRKRVASSVEHPNFILRGICSDYTANFQMIFFLWGKSLRCQDFDSFLHSLSQPTVTGQGGPRWR